MLARDCIAPLAASASILVCGPLLSSSTSTTVRLQLVSVHSGKILERATAANRQALPVRVDVHSALGPYDMFTTADMAVLEAVDQARAQDDDLDYTGLFDYEDD